LPLLLFFEEIIFDFFEGVELELEELVELDEVDFEERVDFLTGCSSSSSASTAECTFDKQIEHSVGDVGVAGTIHLLMLAFADVI
jgi:hypothetical protein